MADAVPPPADDATPAEAPEPMPRWAELDTLGEGFVATLLTQLDEAGAADAGLVGLRWWGALSSTLQAYYRDGDGEPLPALPGSPPVHRDEVREATARVAHLAASDAVWARALAVLHTPCRVDDEDDWLERTRAVVQLLAVMYGFVDPMDCPDCDAAGPWVHAVEMGVSEATAKAAIDGLQRHVGAASRAIGAVMLEAARDRGTRVGGGAGGRPGGRGAQRRREERPNDVYAHAWLHLVHTSLRCARHMASLEASVRHEHMDCVAMLDGFAANLAGDLLTGMSLSALWAMLDASPSCCEVLTSSYGEVMTTMHTLLTSGTQPQDEEADRDPFPGITDTALPGDEEGGLVEVVIGALWGCSSRVTPLCAAALVRHNLHTAAASLVTCRLTGAARPSAAARVCAAGALAGWVAAAASPVPPEQEGEVSAALAELDALWADPAMGEGISAFMERALLVLDANLAGGSGGAGPAGEDAQHPLSRWGGHDASAAAAAAREVENLTMTDIAQTAMYDWKVRDLSDAVSLLCRLVARASATVGTDAPLAEPPAHVLLPAAVAAFPMCVMLHPDIGLLTPRRVTHLCHRRHALVPALLALSSCSCPIAAAVGSATLARLARACGQSAQSITASQRRLQLTHMLALRGAASGGGVGAPTSVALQLQPSGAVVHASGHLLAAHSPFFAALFSSAARGFASPGPASPGGGSAAVITLHDVDPAAFRALLHYCTTGGCAFSHVADVLAMSALANRFLMPDLVAFTTSIIRDRLAHLRGGMEFEPMDMAAPTKLHVQPAPEWTPIPLAPLPVVVSECLHVLANADTDVVGHTGLVACALDTLAHSIAVRRDEAVSYLRLHVLTSPSELPLGTVAAVQTLVDEYRAEQTAKETQESLQEGQIQDEEAGAAQGTARLPRQCKRKREDAGAEQE